AGGRGVRPDEPLFRGVAGKPGQWRGVVAEVGRVAGGGFGQGSAPRQAAEEGGVRGGRERPVVAWLPGRGPEGRGPLGTSEGLPPAVGAGRGPDGVCLCP